MTTVKEYSSLSEKDKLELLKFLPSSNEVHIAGMVLSRTGLSVTLPENFNVDVHITNFPPQSYGFESSLKKFDKDKVCHLLGLLSSIPAHNKDLIVEDGYVPILAEIVNHYITDYNAYLDYLRATNVIEWDGHGTYSEGHARRGRWKEPYFSARFVRVPTPKFEKLFHQRKFETIEQYRRSKARDATSNCPEYLLKWYNPTKLIIDSVRANDYAWALKNYKIAQGEESWDWNKDKNCPKQPQNQYVSIMDNIYSISYNNDFRIHIDNHVHRLHSVLTNMQKEFRNFLTYDGQQLVSIDIKNSQPYLSCILFNPEFWRENSTMDLNLNKLPQNIIASIRFTPLGANAIPIVTSLNRFFRNLEGHEFDTYKSIVSSGEMYETIMGWIQEERGVAVGRSDVKTIVFKLFFSPNRTNPEDENHWLMRYYKGKFPHVADLFKIIKRQYQGSDEEKQHGRLACLLQAIESEIILHRCCKRIWEEGNHQVPVFTIHDSIATTLEHKDFVKSVMQEELTRAIGLPPRLSEEVWHEEALELKPDDIRHYLEEIQHTPG